MGIYKNRLLESAATDLDSVQTPGDVGVDLDQVEKDIMGPDGIEAHRDEVEDAVEGVVGDPIEEAYMAMYESEYNYGQIMKVLGMAELREASMGRDLVLEAADIKGFFANVKKIIKNLFAKVVEAFKKAINYITSTIASDKKLVEKYKDKIEAGWDTDWKAKGYLFKDKIEMPNSFRSTATKDSLDKLKNEYKNNSFKKFDDEEKDIDASDDYEEEDGVETDESCEEYEESEESADFKDLENAENSEGHTQFMFLMTP